MDGGVEWLRLEEEVNSHDTAAVVFTLFHSKQKHFQYICAISRYFEGVLDQLWMNTLANHCGNFKQVIREKFKTFEMLFSGRMLKPDASFLRPSSCVLMYIYVANQNSEERNEPQPLERY